MPKKVGGENTKKAAGNAKKAEAAAQKTAVENSKKAVEEDREWNKGSKSNAKKEEAEAKKAEAARKKAEKETLLAEEEKAARATPKGANAKTATKKTRGLDLSQLDDDGTSSSSSRAASALNATGIDNALDALSLTSNNPSEKLDRHPERRFKAAYAAYEARRLPELEEEQKGLRRQQRIDMIRKEFEKSPENPFNQASARFDSTRDEIAEIKAKEREKTESRLVGK
ncbi:hypothetical protein MMC16_003507 [Acarospora aff. strigata]|nr:hypothetical protein [Acarospora aff. strigata]